MYIQRKKTRAMNMPGCMNTEREGLEEGLEEGITIQHMAMVIFRNRLATYFRATGFLKSSQSRNFSSEPPFNVTILSKRRLSLKQFQFTEQVCLHHLLSQTLCNLPVTKYPYVSNKKNSINFIVYVLKGEKLNFI